MFNTSFNSDFWVFSKERLLVWKLHVITKIVGTNVSEIGQAARVKQPDFYRFLCMRV